MSHMADRVPPLKLLGGRGVMRALGCGLVVGLVAAIVTIVAACWDRVPALSRSRAAAAPASELNLHCFSSAPFAQHRATH
jgi:hypothetical protein